MDTGKFRGFEVQLEDPGIVWVTFNTPERLNGMTTGIKRDLIEMLNQAPTPYRLRKTSENFARRPCPNNGDPH